MNPVIPDNLFQDDAQNSLNFIESLIDKMHHENIKQCIFTSRTPEKIQFKKNRKLELYQHEKSFNEQDVLAFGTIFFNMLTPDNHVIFYPEKNYYLSALYQKEDYKIRLTWQSYPSLTKKGYTMILRVFKPALKHL